MQFQLPADAENQTHVTVHALLAGTFWIPYNLVFQDCIHEPIEVGCQVPFNAFMITHPTYGRALFDLGLRKVSTTKALLTAQFDSVCTDSTERDGLPS